MHLDEFGQFEILDVQGMLDHIDGLPGQLKEAWNLGLSLPLPQMSEINSVVICGMGGSAIGADLLAAYLFDKVEVPVMVHRDYSLPAFARDRGTLVVLSSHSGNTEETLSSFDEALKRNCQVVGVTTGGQLFNEMSQTGYRSGSFIIRGSRAPLWVFLLACCWLCSPAWG